MKGQLDIFLHNVKTGADEHYHQTNMVTNALKDYIGISAMMNTWLCSDMSCNNFYPISTVALGKLYLFDDTLTESVTNIEFPTEAHLVGYCDRGTDTSHTFKGSLNSLESGATSTGYTTTWDFTTSQLNTTIKALSLSNLRSHTGEHGIANDSRGLTSRPIASAGYRPVYLDSDGYLYTMRIVQSSSSSATITIYKSDTPVTSRITAITVNFNPFSSSGVSFTQIAQYTITEGLYYSSYTGNLICGSNIPGVHGDYLYLPWVTSGTTSNLHYMRFKISDGSFDCDNGVETFTLTNCSLYSIGFAALIGNKIYALGSSTNKIYIADIDNLANVVEATLPYSVYMSWSSDNNGYQFASSLYNCLSVRLNTGCYNAVVYPDGTVFTDTATSGQWYEFGYSQGVYRVPNHLCYIGIGSGSSWNSNSALRAYPSGNYLGTICNLASPVTKTSAQTMKIVYTLTDA